MKLPHLLIAIVAAALPVAALTACRKDQPDATATGAVDAKFHYAVAMTGVV